MNENNSTNNNKFNNLKIELDINNKNLEILTEKNDKILENYNRINRQLIETQTDLSKNTIEYNNIILDNNEKAEKYKKLYEDLLILNDKINDELNNVEIKYNSLNKEFN